MALIDVRLRVEGGPDPAAVSRKLATAERVARQQEQMTRLGVSFLPLRRRLPLIWWTCLWRCWSWGPFLCETGALLQPGPGG